MSTVTTKLTAAMRALQQEVNELEREIDRLQTIKATIRVNALRHGATEEQVERLLDSLFGRMQNVLADHAGHRMGR